MSAALVLFSAEGYASPKWAGMPADRIDCGAVSVRLDPRFPRIIEYKVGESVFAGQASPVSAVELNGKPTVCQVTLMRCAADASEYRLTFPAEQVEITLCVTVEKQGVDLRVIGLKESGTFKIHDFAFPGNALLTADSRRPDAEAAFALWDAEYTWGPNDFSWMPGGHYRSIIQEEIAPLSKLKPGAVNGSYLFLSDGATAAGIASGNYSARKRVQRTVVLENGLAVCRAQNPLWEVRTFDDDAPEHPWVKVFLTPDRNGDGKATWQDAAIVYRNSMPKPFGHEFVKSTVGENIAMNFASGAQQPFLRILDEVKKINLATDGIGNQVIIKGFSSEGHDSANTDYADHWNERAGGLKDFSALLAQARNYNARIGIHINTSEFYPESNRFDPKLFDLAPNGRPRVGWVWLDQSIMIDQVKDFRQGSAMAALDKMRRELPKLDFIYVDTFINNGWVARQLARKLNGLGLPLCTELASALDPWSTWAHVRVKGPAQMLDFLWYSERDICPNDPILRGGRVDDDGFMGWQNRHNFKSFIQGTFSRNLPAKYLKNFELLRFEPGKEARFSGGVKVVKTGANVVVTQDGRTVMSWTGNGANARLFVPWDPKSAPKIYLWDEVGTEQSWELPPSWKDLKEIHLYLLTDCGRTEEMVVPVRDGRVMLKVKKSVPYVIYPSAAPPQKAMAWGEGSPVNDPGFDSHGFASWKPSRPEAAKIENNPQGNPRLILSGAEAAEVSQPLTGLAGGKTYVAGVWVQAAGQRCASISVRSGGKTVTNFADRFDIRHSAPNDPRNGTNYQQLKVWFTVPAGASNAQLVLRAEAGDETAPVEFDDVRVVETRLSAGCMTNLFR